MKRITMKQTHPNLYLGVMLFGFWGVAQGLNLLLFSASFIHAPLKYIIGTGYLIFGTAKLIGANMEKPYLARYGMTACMALSMTVAALALNLFLRGQIKTLHAPLNFFFFGIVQLSAISEPSINPLNMKRPKDES